MATSAVKPLEDHITCSVCLEVYTDPHALSCLHTYCYQCIQGIKHGNHVQCPVCREDTDLREVKKDFKMESFIAVYRNTIATNYLKETVCDLCRDSSKPVQSYCANCEELLCAHCIKVHSAMGLDRDHIVITFSELQQSKTQELDKHIKLVSDEERDMGCRCTCNIELIANIKQAEVRQMAEVNRLRQSIIDDVNSHHDSLLSEIQSINQNTIESLQQQGQMFTEARQQLAGKIQFLSHVSQCDHLALLIETLKHLNSHLQEELAAIHSNLPTFTQNVESSVLVKMGEDWNPKASTWIEKIKEIYPRYRKVKSVDIKFLPTKLCMYRDELWVGAGEDGVFVYNTNLELIKCITEEHFKYLKGIYKTDTDVIVCDNQTGLHVLNQRGDHFKHICSGQFSDATVTNNTLFGLEGVNQLIHVFSKSQNSWVKDRELNLLGYSEGCDEDRLCTTSTCIYVSSCSTHCVCVYSLTGEFLYKTGEQGQGEGLNVGKFNCPFLSDVDSGGKLLLCDYTNHNLQVFDPQTRQWAVIQGLEGLEWPLSAGVGHKHLWVVTYYNKLLKYEAL